jgi:tetratricopeptide (TPR) repeat protein
MNRLWTPRLVAIFSIAVSPLTASAQPDIYSGGQPGVNPPVGDFYASSHREMRIIEDRPIVRDFREAPSAAPAPIEISQQAPKSLSKDRDLSIPGTETAKTTDPQTKSNMISQSDRNRVIDLFNDAVDLLQKGDGAKALSIVQQAEKIVPNNGNFMVLEGTALESLGRWQEAKDVLVRASKMKPIECHVWRELGLVWEQLGNFEEAKSDLTNYVRLADDHKDAEIIRFHVQAIEATIKAKAAEPKNADNYLADIPKEDRTPWIDEKTLLKVFIASGAGVPGYKESYRQGFERALKVWNQALDGKISLTPVDEKSKADIEVTWSNHPHAKGSEGGECIPWVGNGRLGHASITMYTVADGWQPTDVDVYAMELHELGHALGLGGHSTGPGDIMYSSFNALTQTAPELSAHDIATIRRLYAVPHQSVK